MTTIQFRRVLIVVILLALAVVGALVRRQADPASTTHDVASLLMLLWVPVVGNIVGWVIARVRMHLHTRRRRSAAARAPTPDFVHGAPFAPQLLAEIRLRPASVPAEDGPVPAGLHRCAVVVDHEGYSARWQAPAEMPIRRGQTHAVPVEFVVPARALAQLQTGTAFRMLAGDAFIGDGRVLKLLAASAEPLPPAA